MGTFFDKFPRITYDIGRRGSRHFDLITDIFFRFSFMERVKKMKVAYNMYKVQPGDTPNIVADKVYGDSQADWIILYVNDIVDPEVEWYMDEITFTKYLTAKYGSIAASAQQIHHYEQTTSTRIVSFRPLNPFYINTTSQIDGTDAQSEGFANTHPDIPYNDYASMPETIIEYATNATNQQIEITTLKNRVTCYEWEYDRNESRKFIRVLKPEYYPQVKSEFDTLVSEYNPSRRLNFRKVSV